MELSKGMRVEACSSEYGYRGAWFEGVIVSVSKSDPRLCKIRYDKFVTEDKKPLVEDVCPSQLRPIPPHRLLPLHCSAGDAVEAYDTDCWWRGVIITLLPCEEELWAVYLPDSYILKAYRRSDLRPGLQWVGGNWTVIHQERNPSIEQVIRSLTIGNSRQTPVKSLPSEVKVTKVSREGHGKKRIRDVSSKPTAPAGKNSRISGGRKKLRLLANIVPPSKQEDTGDNSRISGARKKLKLIENIAPRHIQEDARDNSRISGVRKKLRRITDIVPERIQEDAEIHKTCNGGKAFEHPKKDDIGPLLSPKKDSIKRVREEQHRKQSPPTPEAHEKARRLNSSESKGRERNLRSREAGEARRKRSNNKRDDCAVTMENNGSTYEREKVMRAAHKWELIVYQKLLWAFHTDDGTLSQERRNLLDALRLRLNITRAEHRIAMKEVVSQQACSTQGVIPACIISS